MKEQPEITQVHLPTGRISGLRSENKANISTGMHVSIWRSTISFGSKRTSPLQTYTGGLSDLVL